MADNAIEKLFEEMRAARVNEDLLREQVSKTNSDYNAARERVKLLAQTLHKHIHDGVPVVQAKMQAHEELKASYQTGTASVGARFAVQTSAYQAIIEQLKAFPTF